eukprot:COSAG01_NODE_6079_length_3864_cov_7.298008_1_plen_427_part_00
MSAIYMVGGPSGAGKDTLLLEARAKLQAAGEDDVVFLKRTITRDATKCTDLEEPVTRGAMQAARAAGQHAFYWEAHDTQYAIPRDDLETALALGRRVVLNVSRSIVEQCLARYASQACEVYFLNISASPETLTQRLLRRGREPPAEVAKRVARAKQGEPAGPHVIHVYNEASVDEGAKMVVAALMGRLTYSLWLEPSRGCAVTQRLQELIASQSVELRGDARGFAAHATLCPPFSCSQRDAVQAVQRVAAALAAPVSCLSRGRLGTSTTNWARALVLELELEGTRHDAAGGGRCSCLALSAAHKAAVRALAAELGPSRYPAAPSHSNTEACCSYRPHISLSYGMFSEAVLEQAVAKVRAALAAVVSDPTVIEADRLTLVRAWAAVTLCMCNADDGASASAAPKIPLIQALTWRALVCRRALVDPCP